MAVKRRHGGHAGGHGWFVTFADLMALMMAFFVMIAAYSTMDKEKMKLMTGSLRDAFGTQREQRFTGMVEVDGLPVRPKLQNAKKVRPEETSETPGKDENDEDLQKGLRQIRDRKFAMAAASLRQALQDLPEIAELSKHILFTETKEGLNIEIVDQDGRSMFPEGAKEPYERTRKLLVKIAETIRAMPNRVIITGHTAALRTPPKGDYGAFDLSADRANAVRQILQSAGVRMQQIGMVAGRADSDPLFPEDPYMAANRRVTITLMKEAPVVPPNIRP
ncbi:MAG: flagellar motor protein MotB [Xanthobacteraceae bacterium]|nr:flagellar motor protein MotB [Xanthobacteraceae bacterium]